jgi:anaerobic magnesium-protoporphyrin IX monomethyl ester cyclase
MNILLINPPEENTVLEFVSDHDSDGEVFIEVEDYGQYPPLGLLYIISYLEANTQGHNLRLIDCVGEKISHLKLRQIIKEFKPDMVGITSFTISLIDVVNCAKITKEEFPDCHVCLGGHHPIAFPFEATQLAPFDSVVVGEGEEAFKHLVDCIENKTDFTNIVGVYSKESADSFKDKLYQDKRFLGKVTLPPAYIDDLDSLPMPNRKFINHINYRNPVGVGDKLATILTTRGCPYLCTYCDVPYKKYRTRTISNVLDEVENCLEMGYNDFHFYDDLFNITSRKVIDFCDEVEKRNIKFSWDFRGRVNAVSRESLIRAKRAGCRMISFGVETGTNEGYKIIKKGTTTEKVQEVFGWCRELGILTVADYMIGFPFEKNPADVRKSMDYLVELDPDFCIIAILMLLPNTEIFYQACHKNITSQEKWIEFSLNPTREFTIDFWSEHMTHQTLVQLRKEAYRKFYLRPKYIFRKALAVRSFYEFKTKLKGFAAILR